MNPNPDPGPAKAHKGSKLLGNVLRKAMKPVKKVQQKNRHLSMTSSGLQNLPLDAVSLSLRLISTLRSCFSYSCPTAPFSCLSFERPRRNPESSCVPSLVFLSMSSTHSVRRVYHTHRGPEHEKRPQCFLTMSAVSLCLYIPCVSSLFPAFSLISTSGYRCSSAHYQTESTAAS